MGKRRHREINAETGNKKPRQIEGLRWRVYQKFNEERNIWGRADDPAIKAKHKKIESLVYRYGREVTFEFLRHFWIYVRIRTKERTPKLQVGPKSQIPSLTPSQN